MQDRVANYPNRWKLTPVTGENDTYDFTRADDPVIAGTPLNKATFLTDATAALVGALSGNTPSLPDEALAELATVLSGLTNALKAEYGTYVGNGLTGEANAITLNFSIKPLIVFVLEASSYGYKLIAIYGDTTTFVTSAAATLSWGTTSIKYYSSNAGGMCNVSGRNYSYMAIGEAV